MVRQDPDGQIHAQLDSDADEVYVACDCVGWFLMHRVYRMRWEVALNLPPGQHHLRYYARRGQSTVWCHEESIEVPDREVKG